MPRRIEKDYKYFEDRTKWDKHNCLVWTGCLNADGYGSIGRVDKGKSGLAHRFYYEMMRGTIPAGKVLDHVCRNRACINPGHLEPVDPIENLRRGYAPAAINRRKKVCKRGHPLNKANTRIGKTGKRQCIACQNLHNSGRLKRD